MIVLDLPAPPSVNRMSRNGRGAPLGNRSPVVNKWRVEADSILLCQTACNHQTPSRGLLKSVARQQGAIIGHFNVEIILSPGMGDLDNRIKPLLDYLQSREFIEDDKFCDKITISWGETKYGCRIILNSA